MNLCDNRTVLGVSCEDYRRHGALAEYVAVPEHIVYELPEGLGFDQAAMVEAVSIAVHAAHRARPAVIARCRRPELIGVAPPTLNANPDPDDATLLDRL